MISKERLLIFFSIILTSTIVIAGTFDSRFYLVVFSLLIVVTLLLLFIRRKISLFSFVLTFIPLAILSPAFSVGIGPAIRLDDLWLVLGGIGLLIQLLHRNTIKNIKLTKIQKKVITIFLFFTFWVVLSIFISTYRAPLLYTNRDWFEVVKLGKYLLLFIVCSFLKPDNLKVNKFMNVVVTSIGITALFGVFQYFNTFAVNEWLSIYYVVDNQYEGLINQQRIAGTIGNPNAFAALLLIGLAITFSRIINLNKKLDILFFFLFLSCLFLTLSRTGLVAAVVLGVFVFSFSVFKSKNIIKPFLLVSIPASVIGIGLWLAPESFFWRIGFLNDISTDNSFQTRVTLWKGVYEQYIKNNLILGTGPIKGEKIEFDNEWVLILKTYGLVGMGIFLSLFITIYRGLKKQGYYASDFNKSFGFALRGLMLALAVYMIPAVIFHQLQIMPVIIVVLAVCLAFSENNGRVSYE